MASFFSDLSKSFQSAAKSIQKMTAEGVEATKRNGELRALREEQKKLFAELGEAYYASRNAQEADEQLGLIVGRIDQINERVKIVTAELDALGDKRRCPACEAAVDKKAKFCAECGAKMPESEPEPQGEPQDEADAGPERPQAEFCAECGALRQDGARFCAVCGRAFVETAKPEVEINWPEAKPQSAEEPPAEEPSAEEPPAEEPDEQ